MAKEVEVEQRPLRALITGASSGIGRALAFGLAEQGAQLLVVARRPAPLAQVGRELLARGADLKVLAADLRRPADVLRVARASRSFLGDLDLLVHSAATLTLNAQGAAAKAEIALNLGAPQALTAALLPWLRRAKGQVVCFGSAASARPIPDQAAYGASKAGLEAWAQALRAQEAPRGVNVLVLRPDITATPLAKPLPWPPVQSPEAVAAWALRCIQSRRQEADATWRSWVYRHLALWAPGLVDRVILTLHRRGYLG